MSTPYELLKVDPKADELQLRIAYRQTTHDLKSQKITDEQFRCICRAYETLGGRNKRNKYDETKQWINKIDLCKYTPQQLASEPSLFKELKEIFKNATLKQIDSQDPETGHTSLYCASRTCNIDAVIYLIEQGANPDLSQKHGSTALHVCSFYGHPEIVRCILQSGANFLEKNSFGKGNLPESEIFQDDIQTKTIFNELKKEAYVQTAANQLDWLKEHLVNHVDEQYFRLRQTLLHCASKKGYFDIVEWLIQEKQCDLDIVDINLNSALHLAAYGGYSTIVEYLIKKGANSLLINKWGMTAEQEGLIHQSKIQDLFDNIKQENMFEMITKGYIWWFKYYFGNHSPDSTNNEGVNLLYVACREGQYEIAKWLLEHGANVNIKLTQGSKSTPLHGAAYGGHVSIVELLLKHGADINIKNNYEETVFDNAKDNQQIKLILNKYKTNLLEDRFLEIDIYGDGAKSGNLPLAKVQLQYNGKYTDLIRSLPDHLQKYTNFSIARRPLNFDNEETTILSAVCCSRYGKSQFIEMPICLTIHERARYTHSGHVLSSHATFLNTRDFQQNFLSQCQSKSILIKGQLNSIQKFQFNNLLFEFPLNCCETDIRIEIDYIISPSIETFRLCECVYLFQTKYLSNEKNRLLTLPSVTIVNDCNVYLYNWIHPSPYWFATSLHHRRLPLIGGRHAFIRHVEIIPKEFYLLPDMFIRSAVGEVLSERLNPFYCRCLKIREHNKERYPLIAYHGTSIQVISSILMDGFVMPSTVVSSGKRICPPANHIARQKEAFGIADFANGIFLSPSIHYCSDPAYAVIFSDGDQRIIVILECAVKAKSFGSFPSTVKTYKADPSDDIKNIEWRFTNPADIEILSVLFIPITKSRLDAAKIRAKKLDLNPNVIK